ncbi:MAG: TM0106 family RecB-like putative nuclease, partial [Chloroflexi bacterium]|nr:TM0106 family RecB-like putative nuclease [Chloroflexota bacterium]
MQLIDGVPVYSATDLVGFVECRHLADLDRAALAGLVARPMREDPQLDRIAKRGEQHEARFLATLEAEGKLIAEVAWEDDPATHRGDRYREMAEATREAMRDGADVVYQATFFDDDSPIRRFGRADFLMRVETPSDLGAWSYEVWDTKLARHAKASAVLQLCFYSDLLAGLQGPVGYPDMKSDLPERMTLALGGNPAEIASFRLANFAAYYRLVKREYETLIASGSAAYPPLDTRPDPVEHCDVCRWDERCRGVRRAGRDLALTAGITSRQKRTLRERDVDTLDALAVLPLPVRFAHGRPLDPPLERGSEQSLRRVREQARLQVEGERAGRLLSERLPPPRT